MLSTAFSVVSAFWVVMVVSSAAGAGSMTTMMVSA
jgi:hypothetical protein